MVRLVVAGGVLSIVAGLALIWFARTQATRPMYVSEMGAPNEPTAGLFQLSLLLVAIGALLISAVSTHLTSRVRWLARWTPALSLAVGGIAFVLASQVTCTEGCPLPVGPSFTWQDLIHTSSAVLGFAAACFAMLQLSFNHQYPELSRLSLGSAIAVALVASAGGLLSLMRVAMDVGGLLEFVATTIALLWLVVVGVVIARRAHERAHEVAAHEFAILGSDTPEARLEDAYLQVSK